jgi:AcrR family transcriptional regulator
MPKKFGEKENQIIINKLKESGLELFSKYGLKKTSIKDLTSEAGIAQGSFYNFYHSKEELYFNLLESEEEEMATHMKNIILNSGSAKEAIKITIIESCSLFEKTPLLRRIYESNDYELMVRKLPQETLLKHQKSDTELVTNTIMKVKTDNEKIKAVPEVISGILRGITLLNLHREEIGKDIYPEIIEILAESIANGIVQKTKASTTQEA